MEPLMTPGQHYVPFNASDPEDLPRLLLALRGDDERARRVRLSKPR